MRTPIRVLRDAVARHRYNRALSRVLPGDTITLRWSTHDGTHWAVDTVHDGSDHGCGFECLHPGPGDHTPHAVGIVLLPRTPRDDRDSRGALPVLIPGDAAPTPTPEATPGAEALRGVNAPAAMTVWWVLGDTERHVTVGVADPEETPGALLIGDAEIPYWRITHVAVDRTVPRTGPPVLTVCSDDDAEEFVL